MNARLQAILVAGTLGTALLGAQAATASPAPASPAAALAAAQAGAFPGETYAQYYGGGRRYYGGRGYRRGYGGAGVAAGVIGGLAAGALIGGALSAQAAPAYGPGVAAYGPGPGQPVGNVYGRDPNFVSYCASRYRSFDPVSGTYLGRDGYRYPCE